MAVHIIAQLTIGAWPPRMPLCIHAFEKVQRSVRRFVRQQISREEKAVQTLSRAECGVRNRLRARLRAGGRDNPPRVLRVPGLVLALVERRTERVHVWHRRETAAVHASRNGVRVHGGGGFIGRFMLYIRYLSFFTTQAVSCAISGTFLSLLHRPFHSLRYLQNVSLKSGIHCGGYISRFIRYISYLL